MPVFEEKREELEHFETMMGVPRGRLAVTMDTITDAMALVGQHGVYCQSQRWPGKPVLDIQMVMKGLTRCQGIDPERDGRVEEAAGGFRLLACSSFKVHVGYQYPAWCR